MSLRRREFLSRGAGLFSVGFMGPELLTAMARADSNPTRPSDPILVMVQMNGGNDGLNTVIPYADPLYYTNRPTIGIPKEKVLPVSAMYGLHPSLANLKPLYDSGNLGIMPGAGYPNPNRSHFRSMEIWQTADPVQVVPDGWLGRYLDHVAPPSANPLYTINVAQSLPKTFASERSSVPSVPNLASYKYMTDGKRPQDAGNLVQTFSHINSHVPIDRPYVGLIQKELDDAYTSMERLQSTGTYQPSVAYPKDGFSQALELVAQIIVKDLGTKIFYMQLSGFDTHANQANTQAKLLGQLGDGLAAFFTDVKNAGRADDLMVVTFSEFGRRAHENASKGTDHGAAGTMFVLGGRVRGGFHGGLPSLANLDSGDLKYTVDFRSVYATLLQNWLGTDPAAILGAPFPLVDFV
jgi:uncharacterized protein (DUF1501 family)